jgi:hypothetical protein
MGGRDTTERRAPLGLTKKSLEKPKDNRGDKNKDPRGNFNF